MRRTVCALCVLAVYVAKQARAKAAAAASATALLNGVGLPDRSYGPTQGPQFNRRLLNLVVVVCCRCEVRGQCPVRVTSRLRLLPRLLLLLGVVPNGCRNWTPPVTWWVFKENWQCFSGWQITKPFRRDVAQANNIVLDIIEHFRIFYLFLRLAPSALAVNNKFCSIVREAANLLFCTWSHSPAFNVWCGACSLQGRCGAVGSTLAFGSIGHVMGSYPSTAYFRIIVFSKLRSLAYCLGRCGQCWT